jgi:undecaprenyl diphosphate synthase
MSRNKIILFSLFFFLPFAGMEGVVFETQQSEDCDWDTEDEDEIIELPKGFDLLDKNLMPKHIGIIMDGNRRWAKNRGFSGIAGHEEGAEVLIDLVKFFCNVDLGIDTITLYAFSTENWKRSDEEVDLLMELFSCYFDELLPYLKRYSIRLETIGDLSTFPLALQEKLQDLKEISFEHEKYTLVIALNYGGRDEIKRAFFSMVTDLEEGAFLKEDISEELIGSYLDTSRFGDPALIIRTGGDIRVSNFLLWQMAYAELHFTPILWPDFSNKDLVDILIEFQGKKRRFGR